MRKFVLVTVLAVLLSALAFNAAAAEESHPHQGDHCVCGGSAVGVHDHACESIQWTPMPTDTVDFAKLADGNYYLTQDLTVTGATSFSGKKLTVCLNGYDINTTAGAVFGYVKQGSVLNFCDCSGTQDADGSWTWGGTVTANRTGKARSYGGVINLNANTTANIYGGNFVGSTGGSCKQGGVFNICNDGHGGEDGDQNKDLYDTNLNIYNCHITGGDVATSGGAINSWHYVNINLYGGVIEGGSGTSKGNLSISAFTTMTVESCTVIGGTPGSVLLMDGSNVILQYSTLSDALSKVAEGQYIRLLGDISEAVTVPSGVCIDLAGNDLSGVTVENGAIFMDSTTDSYNGDLAGSVTPASGTPAIQNKTDGKRYLAVRKDGAYSFHRFYADITKITLKPGTLGMGYKATFVGSEEVQAALSSTTAYGYRMWLDEDSKITRGFPSSRFGGSQEVTLRIDSFLNSSLTAAENEDRANQKVYACAYIRLADGTYIESAPVAYSFRQMLELANANYEGYSQTQQEALLSLSSQFSASMVSWDIHNIHHANGSIWQQVTSASFNTLLKNNSNQLPSGSYVLTEDVDIGSRSIRINDGRAVNICLNGYTLHSSVRMFNTHGQLNFCDCHANGQEGTLQSSYTIDDDDTDGGEFTSIVYCYANSVTNLYGGNIKSTVPLTFAGLIAVSHDNSDKTLPVGVFNMYGGVIHGCTVVGQSNKTAAGGNITLWNGGIFNLYGGTIYGGTAQNGGAFNITADCTLNIYGGSITGGNANEGSGGNIYSIGTVNMYGGTVTGGSATTADSHLCTGGNIYSSGALKLYGGTVSDGTAQYGKGGNIYASGTVHLEDVTVTGGNATTLTVDEVAQLGTGLGSGIYVTTSGNNSNCVTATGNVYIADNVGSDLYLGNLATLDAKALSATARISLEAQARARISSDPSTIGNFTTSMENTKLALINGGVALVADHIDTEAVTTQGSTFRVGYSMSDISPEEDGLTMSSFGNPNGRKSSGINYRLYATTVAITDQQNNTVLMITIDLQNPPEALMSQIYQRISDVTGVPQEHIYITATHTHNCPFITTSGAANQRYRAHFIDMLIQGTMDAMADRSDATMEVGSFDTQGMNWTRHYYYYENNDTTTEKIYYGDQFGQPPQNGETVYRVRETDSTMHMLAFNRTDKQPVLLVNWRAHPHRSGGKTKYTVDADVIGATREYMHSNTDYLFAYYQGAAGNVNTTSRISGETYKSGKITEYGNELGRQIVELGLPKLKAAETGLIQTKRIIYSADVDHTQDSKYEQALALQTFYNEYPDEMDTYEEQIAKAKEFGFTSVFHATRLIAKYKLGATKDMELNIFSIGDSIAFYTAPAELWDSFSEELEGVSPFETTFCIGYCNGSVAYIPYKLDYYTSYEYFYCLFTQEDTINQMREYYLESLNEQYENAR